MNDALNARIMNIQAQLSGVEAQLSGLKLNSVLNESAIRDLIYQRGRLLGKLPILLFAVGRDDEIGPGHRNIYDGAPMSHSLDAEDIAVLGPQGDIRIGRGNDGDMLTTVVKTPSGGFVWIALQTRYQDTLAVGYRDSIPEALLSRHTVHRYDFADLSAEPDDSPLEFHVVLARPDDPKLVDIWTARQLVPDIARVCGRTNNDGYIKWDTKIKAVLERFPYWDEAATYDLLTEHAVPDWMHEILG